MSKNLRVATSHTETHGAAALCELIKAGVLAGFSETIGDDDIAIVRQVPAGSPVHGPWQSAILLLTQGVKITLKFFFRTAASRRIAARALQRTDEEVDVSFAFDVMREICNESAGSIKKGLEGPGTSVGVGLPLVTRGVDEIFFDPEENHDTYSETWELGSSDGTSLFCTVYLYILDREKVAQITWDSSVSIEGGGIDIL